MKKNALCWRSESGSYIYIYTCKAQWTRIVRVMSLPAKIAGLGEALTQDVENGQSGWPLHTCENRNDGHSGMLPLELPSPFFHCSSQLWANPSVCADKNTTSSRFIDSSPLKHLLPKQWLLLLPPWDQPLEAGRTNHAERSKISGTSIAN